ncbi:MAG: hypothetical protein NTX59_03705 [Elusimicrobia bacterium]|nr:hypothetical protein [Elusimicrobiota bacterium]
MAHRDAGRTGFTLPALFAATLACSVCAPPVWGLPENEDRLPDFNLGSMRVADVLKYMSVTKFPVSPPARVTENADSDSGILPETYPLYGPHKAGRVRLTSLIKLTIDGKKGKAEVKFPDVRFEGACPGDRSVLFIKVAEENLSPALSWAAVICSGRSYLGYKGANLKLPEKSGNFSITETMALGCQKTLVSETHPWLAAGLAGEGGRDLDRLCSRAFREKMMDYNVKTLPRQMEGFDFQYNPEKNTLKITW